MKVLLVNVLYKSGSTGRLCYDISNYLNSKGIFNITACRFLEHKENKVYEVSTWLDCHIHNRLVKYTGLQGYFSFLRTIKFIDFIKKENFDIVHIHNIYGSFINVNLFISFLSKNNIKVIYTLHDCQAFTGGCPHFTSVNCSKWIDGCNNCIFRNKKIDFSSKVYNDKKRLFTSFKKNNLLITTVSNWLNRQCSLSFFKSYNIKTIYNGINTDVFYNEHLDVKSIYSDKFVILGIANVWDDRKGLNKFIDLSYKLSSDEIIILIGLSENQINQLPSNIIGITKTESVDELRNYYNNADVFVNLSTEETFGLVVGEALACGTPAIVYNSTGCSEVMGHRCGIILDKFDISSLYDSICLVRKNGKKYYSSYAEKHIKTNFNIDKMQKEYYKTYIEFTGR